MPRHIRIACPNCRRSDLRIRPEYLGRQVSCKYCAHRFLARSADEPGTEPSPAGPAPEAQTSAVVIDEAGQRAIALEGGIERVRSELTTRTGEYTTALQQLRDAEGRLGQSQVQVQGVQEQLDQALGQLRRISEPRDERVEADAERGRLLSLVEVLRSRAADASHLEVEQRTDRAEIDRLTGELQRTREVLGQPIPKADEGLARELETVHAERDALREELQGVRAELDARAADLARLDRSTEESASLHAERDQLRVELLAGSRREEQLEAELIESRRLLVEEAALHEATRGDLSRIREVSARWEAERKALLSRIEELQTQIREDERGLRDEQARSEAALLGLQEQLDSARTQFDKDRRAFEEELRRLHLENETDGQEREAATQLAEAARQELTQARSEIARLFASADHARQLSEAAGRRNDELDLQVRILRGELERLQREHEADFREHRRRLSAAGGELEPARGELMVEREHTAPAPAVRANIDCQLAGDQDGLRRTIGHADGLAAEGKALRDPLLMPHGDVIAGHTGHGNDLESARSQIEELTEQLLKARGANEQLSSILNVIGLITHPHKEGTGS